MAMASPAVVLPEEEAAVFKNVGEGHGSAAGRPTRLRVVRPDVAELLQRGSPRPRRPKTRTTATEDERARYGCAFEEEDGGLAPPRLVWAKVKGHPWWPGQVFDPADASALALDEHRRCRRGSTLVAYFWDKTFAWVPPPPPPSLLRPFRDGFPRLAAVHSHVHVRGRTGAATMTWLGSAVDAALGEVARRVDAGLSCFCAGVARKQAVENTGVREGAHGAVVDAAFARDALRGDAFVRYLSALAVAPLAGADKLDLTVATAQLSAFTRWRGARGLPVYTAVYGIDDLADGRAMKAAAAKGRRATARDNDACVAKWKMSRCSSSSRARDDDDDAMELDGFEPMPQPLSHQTATTTKMGKLMSRAARQMSRSPAATPAATRKANCNDDDHHQVNSGLRMMARAASAADHTIITAPSVKLQNGGLKDEPPVAGLVLNFTSPSAVPSMTDLVKIFSQFGPIMEIRMENSAAVVVIFKRRADAETACSGTAKIGALSVNLISFRLTYSLLLGATHIGSPETPVNTDEEDHLEAVQ